MTTPRFSKLSCQTTHINSILVLRANKVVDVPTLLQLNKEKATVILFGSEEERMKVHAHTGPEV